jgi:hypothetical protein
MQKNRIKSEIEEKIKKDESFTALIAETMDVKVSTVKRWLKDQDPQLTQPIPVKLIEKRYKVKDIVEIYETVAKYSTVN